MNDLASLAALQLPAIGQPFGGGIFAGRLFRGAHPYALIIAPQDIGELESTVWSSKRAKVAGATSYSDGLANTEAMAAAGSALGKWARGLRHEGFEDWYLPSRLEALLAFGEVRDQFERDWYWTSTQFEGDEAHAWSQGFDHGTQDNTRKASKLRARAVRRVAIR